jgi:hypothetical protein
MKTFYHRSEFVLCLFVFQKLACFQNVFSKIGVFFVTTLGRWAGSHFYRFCWLHRNTPIFEKNIVKTRQFLKKHREKTPIFEIRKV